LRWHVSELNNATETIPEEWYPKIVEFEKKMGYRLALRRMVHPSAADPGGKLLVEMEWENEGVAPPYRNYPLTFNLRNKKTLAEVNIDAGVDITSWLPGTIPLQLTVDIPADIEAGDYELGVGLIDDIRSRPAILLANEGRGEDGWYRWSEIKIR
jgi:hypothetical protein